MQPSARNISLPRVLIAEPSQPIANSLRKFLDGWAQVQVVTYLDEAVQMVRSRAPDVLIASVSGVFDGEILAPQVRKLCPEAAIILAFSLPWEVKGVVERVRAAGADGFMVAPFKQHHVLAMVHAVSRLNGLAAQIGSLQTKFEQLKSVATKQALPSKWAGVNAVERGFFKKYMLLEIKRSKRYQYPVTVLLVSLDRLGEQLGDSAPEFQRATIQAEATEALSALMRDIDLATTFAEDRYLLFLPNTGLKGGLEVARRVVSRLSTLDSFPGGTASVGIASFDPQAHSKEKVSFGVLVRDAAAALKQAQLAGGNCFRPEASPKKKKSRISMG